VLSFASAGEGKPDSVVIFHFIGLVDVEQRRDELHTGRRLRSALESNGAFDVLGVQLRLGRRDHTDAAEDEGDHYPRENAIGDPPASPPEHYLDHGCDPVQNGTSFACYCGRGSVIQALEVSSALDCAT
jgi:hypothetical protein